MNFPAWLTVGRQFVSADALMLIRMDLAASICFVVAAVAELGGLALLIQQAKVAKSQLSGWEAANPKQLDDGTWAQIALVNSVVSRVLADQARPRQAVALLGVGIVVGLVGNFLSL